MGIYTTIDDRIYNDIARIYIYMYIRKRKEKGIEKNIYRNATI